MTTNQGSIIKEPIPMSELNSSLLSKKINSCEPDNKLFLFLQNLSTKGKHLLEIYYNV